MNNIFLLLLSLLVIVATGCSKSKQEEGIKEKQTFEISSGIIEIIKFDDDISFRNVVKEIKKMQMRSLKEDELWELSRKYPNLTSMGNAIAIFSLDTSNLCDIFHYENVYSKKFLFPFIYVEEKLNGSKIGYMSFETGEYEGRPFMLFTSHCRFAVLKL